MNNLINWQLIKEKSIYEQLKDELIKQKELDKEQLLIQDSYDTDEVLEQLDNIEVDFNFYNKKLALTTKVSELDNEKQHKYFETIAKIDCLNNISNNQKLKMMISYGVLINYFTGIHERTDEELFMLSAYSSGIDLEDYTYYVGILSNEQVSRAIVGKTDILKTQVNIAYEVTDSQDEFPYNFITTDIYEELVANAVSVVNKYNIDMKTK